MAALQLRKYITWVKVLGIRSVVARFVWEPSILIKIFRGQSLTEFSLQELSKYVETDPVIVEAGAADGTDSEKFLSFWPGCRLFCLEPHRELFKELASRVSDRAHCVNLALSPVGSPRVRFYEASNQAHSSSILPPTLHEELFPEVEFTQEIVEVGSVTLDNFMKSVGDPEISLLWLDLQGAELACLQGGGQVTLSRVKTIHMEVARVATYENQATLREVVNYLSSQGFELREIRAPFVFGNAIFTRLSEV